MQPLSGDTIKPDGAIRTIRNAKASLSVDLYGGAITAFHLNADKVNPLSFAFSKEEMPASNREGAPYQGHFVCLGRWGKPSAGELDAGLPDHGEAAGTSWITLPRENDRTLGMEVECPLEGLKLDRRIRMDETYPVCAVEESVRNTAALGRLYNIVQHPTLAAPFLDNSTVVNCNATLGFDQFGDSTPEEDPLHWPYGRHKAGGHREIDLRTPLQPYNSVFSFIADPEEEYAWITAWSPRFRLLLGYVWKRRDYPWIHVWQHWENGQLRFRGMEFGTAALHRPFKSILDTGLCLFGEKTTEYIDAGETSPKLYMSFLCRTGDCPHGIHLSGRGSRIKIIQEKEICYETGFGDFL